MSPSRRKSFMIFMIFILPELFYSQTSKFKIIKERMIFDLPVAKKPYQSILVIFLWINRPTETIMRRK